MWILSVDRNLSFSFFILYYNLMARKKDVHTIISNKNKKKESRERDNESRQKRRKSERGKKINSAKRIAYKRVKDPRQGRSPEKALPRTVIIYKNLNDKYNYMYIINISRPLVKAHQYI